MTGIQRCFAMHLRATNTGTSKRLETIVKTLARTIFREIVQDTREQAAANAWERARIASNLRHLAINRGDRQSARRLSWMKQEAIQLVASLLPDQLKITLDSDHHIGLVSVRFEGHGRLHLSANSSIGKAPGTY